MTTPSSGPSGFNDPQVNLGGADATEKTSYVTGHGADPDAQRPAAADAVANVRTGGLGTVGWILVLAAVLVAIFYGFAAFR